MRKSMRELLARVTAKFGDLAYNSSAYLKIQGELIASADHYNLGDSWATFIQILSNEGKVEPQYILTLMRSQYLARAKRIAREIEATAARESTRAEDMTARVAAVYEDANTKFEHEISVYIQAVNTALKDSP